MSLSGVPGRPDDVVIDGSDSHGPSFAPGNSGPVRIGRSHESIEKLSSPASVFSLSLRMRALRSGATNRPSRAMHTGTISIRSFGAALATERAERIETSCSALRPPKSRIVRMGIGDEFTCHPEPPMPRMGLRTVKVAPPSVETEPPPVQVLRSL